MKKLLVIMVLLLSTAMLFAQNTGISSVISDVSEGMFSNAIDSAANVGPGFDDLSRTYIFSGLTNLVKLDENGGSVTFSDNASTTPMWFGFYLAGEMPLSVFLGFDGKDANNNQVDYTNYTQGAPVSINDSETLTTTEYQWNDSKKSTVYTGNTTLDEFSGSIQLLTMLGPVNTGLYFSYANDNNSNKANNYVFSDSHYYNENASDPTKEPVAKLDYTKTETKTDHNNTDTIKIGVPLFLETGNISHSVNILSTIKLENDSNTYVTSCTDKPYSALNYTFENNETIDTNSKLNFDLDYTIGLPALFKNNDSNVFFVAAGFGVDIYTPVYSEVNDSTAFAYAGSEAEGVKGTRTYNSTNKVFESGVNIDFNLSISHSLFFDLGPVEFAFKPVLDFEFYNYTDPLLVSKTYVVKTDSDANGEFNGSDTITTTVTNYSNTSIIAGDNAKRTYITTTFSLPMAVKVTPEEWPFSVNLGSKPNLSLTNKMVTTKTQTSSTEEEEVLAEPTEADKPIVKTTNAASTNESSYSYGFIDVSADHNIGLSVPVGDYVSLDVDLGLSTSSVNILDFKNMIIQAVISLP